MTDPSRPILAAKALRAFFDGLIALVLPLHLVHLGLTAERIGFVVTATLLGSAVLTLSVGMITRRFGIVGPLRAVALLMIATGLGGMICADFLPFLVLGFIGTLNPTGGDVTPFLPLEQTLLAGGAGSDRRTLLYARYSFLGAGFAALGSVAGGGLEPAGALIGLSEDAMVRLAFLFYAASGAVLLIFYRGLDRFDTAPTPTRGLQHAPVHRSIFILAGLFAVDSFGGGFLVQPLLVLWLTGHFGMAASAVGAVFFITGLLGAVSQFMAVRVSRRIGLVNTMVFTHIPAGLCVIAIAFAPDLTWALALLFVRAALQQMDVPVRSAFVMAITPPADRAAAAGITAVPRSLAEIGRASCRERV